MLNVEIQHVLMLICCILPIILSNFRQNHVKNDFAKNLKKKVFRKKFEKKKHFSRKNLEKNFFFLKLWKITKILHIITFRGSINIQICKSLSFCKKKSFCLFPTNNGVSEKKIVFFRSKTSFLGERHEKFKFCSYIRDIIQNHSKSFFILFWGHINDVRSIFGPFPKKNFEFKFRSFWPKNAIFCPFSFWPYPFFGRKQTNYPKIPAEYPLNPKSSPKNFLWSYDKNWAQKSKK